MTEQEQKDLLEQMIDESSVADVLHLISDVCHEKGDHVRENWQDVVTARVWDTTGKKVCMWANGTEV